MRITELIEAHNCKMEDWILTIPDNSVNVICTDPPYKYLKKQKLESDWDETLFFDNVKRILKDDGFIVMFGRGSSFYRWNTMLDDRGFVFKEEIVWDKKYGSSPVTPITRHHETISIWTINGIFNKIKVDYVEQKEFQIESLINDVKRLKSALKNKRDFDAMLNFLKTGNVVTQNNLRTLGNNTTVQSQMKQQPQAVKTLQAVVNGMREKSIIQVKRDHYQTSHPTQKPIRLIERLLNLVTKPNDVVYDFFSGSFSTAIACENLGLNFKGCEKETEYFYKGIENIKNKCHQKELNLK